MPPAKGRHDQSIRATSNTPRCPCQSWIADVLTAVDRLVVGVVDVAQAVETYRNLGFTVTHGGGAEDGSHQTAYAVFGDFSMEFRDTEASPPVFEAATSGREPGEAEGIHGIVFRSDNLDAEIARLKSSGFHVSDPVDDPTDGGGGSMSRRSVAVDSPIPVGVVEHHHAAAERSAFVGDATTHPNTATVLERIYLAVESIDRGLERFEQLLGVPAPEPEMGTVIMSLMSVFYVGDVGIAVAEPRGDGPTASALSANGPGLFQVLFRAEHLDRAAALMVENGVPPPTRGTRLSGESALLVEPAHACNLFVALAGPP